MKDVSVVAKNTCSKIIAMGMKEHGAEAERMAMLKKCFLSIDIAVRRSEARSFAGGRRRIDPSVGVDKDILRAVKSPT
jgi:hypothetical protein